MTARTVTGIHRGPPRYYPHLDRTLIDGDEVPGVAEDLVQAAYYLEPAPKPKPAKAAPNPGGES